MSSESPRRRGRLSTHSEVQLDPPALDLDKMQHSDDIKSRRETSPTSRWREPAPRTRLSALGALLCLGLLVFLLRSSAGEGSYTLCTKGGPRIYTVEPSKPVVECIAVEGKHIVATGSFGAS